MRHSLREYKNIHNTINYIYVEQYPVTKKCAVLIPAGSFSHSGLHKCDKATEHMCKSKCPDCSCFCSKPFHHLGSHSSDSHRNKDRCVYISAESVLSKEIDTDNGATMCKFDAGEVSQPENCTSCCLRNGRGHSHPLICKGGNL